MRNYLPYFIDGVINLAVACLFIFLYLNKKQPKLYMKKWVLLGALLFFVLAGNETYKVTHQYLSQKVPSRNELESALANKGSMASKELLYQSPDGYQILVPEGLTYTSSKGAISLVATNRSQSNTSITIMVMKQSATQDVDSLVKDLVQVGIEANPPKKYVFQEKGTDPNLRRGYVEAANNGGLVKAVILITRKDRSMYQLMISAPKNNFEQVEAEIEKVLSSFKVL